MSSGAAQGGVISIVVVIAELLVALWPLVLIPAALLTLVRPPARIVAFLLGPVVFILADRMIGPSGPDNPMLIIPIVGVCLSVAAALAEGAVRAWRALRRRLDRADEAEVRGCEPN